MRIITNTRATTKAIVRAKNAARVCVAIIPMVQTATPDIKKVV
jgi:hypothetical protein